MRIIRFVDDDGRVQLGMVCGDDSAEVVVDRIGVLGRTGLTTMLPGLRGKHAVVADDDANMRRLVEAVLDKAGCHCTVCCDGAEAMSAIQQEDIDLVVSDICMPHYNGYEIFAAAREQHEDLPIVLITGFGYDPSHSLVRAAQDGHEIVLYKPFTPQQLIDEVRHALEPSSGHLWEALQPSGKMASIMQRLAPIEPTDIVCIGRNYIASGTDRANLTAEDDLEVFLKPSSAVLSPGEPIVIPAFEEIDPRVACEGELAIVIGRDMHQMSAEAVLDSVIGYTMANDVTARHFQTTAGSPQWMRGKGFDTFCPIGPMIVTPDEADLGPTTEIRTLVNDNVIRRGRLGDMIRPIATILEELSNHMTLRAGTVVLTGAPPVLDNASPDVRPGDVVAVEVDGLGRLESPVEAAP